MKNYWIAVHKLKDRYKKYTAYLYTMTTNGPDYIEPQPLAPEVIWTLNYDAVVWGFAIFEGKTLIYGWPFTCPIAVQAGNEIRGTFNLTGLP